ncbi:MAG: hypothetical protein HY712_06415 [candidate division NC10 bacterium]|nr:hypothetical protein [candidate division NC10 bacterium]
MADPTGFVRCPFCACSLFLDLTGVRLHFCYHPRLSPADLPPLLRRRVGAPRASSGAIAGSSRLVFRPFWSFGGAGGARLMPAWPALASFWSGVVPPAGQRTVFDPAAMAGGTEVVEPAVPEAAARIQACGAETAEPGVLIHVPFFELRLRLGSDEREVAVEACSGRVYGTNLGAGAVAAAGGRRRLRRLATAGWVGLFVAGASLPVWWLSAPIVGIGAWILYHLILAQEQEEAG